MESHSELHLRIVILVDRLRVSAFAEGKILTGWDREYVEGKLRRAGFLPSEVGYLSISKTTKEPTQQDYEVAAVELNRLNVPVLLPLDELPLRFTTGKQSIWKWHLSPLDASTHFTTRKVIPSFHPDQIRKQWELGFYFERALIRAKAESSSRTYTRKPRNFLIQPKVDVILEVLSRIKNEPVHSIDIETGAGQINTFGVAWTPSDAIAVTVLPDNYGPDNYYRIWSAIRDICEGPSRKVFQNAPYETMYLSQYGISFNRVFHDTMVAQKFLYPEFEMGLDNVGRLHTNEPYWKDTGKVVSGEGGKKDWANIRDWYQHGLYNCLDTSGTLEACENQRKELEKRGLLGMYDNYLMELYGPVNEMNLRGLPVDLEVKEKLTVEAETKIDSLKQKLSQDINPRSPKQKLVLLRSKGYKIPKIKDKTTGFYKESVNELSLKKLRLDHSSDTDIQTLLEISKLEKAVSSYLGADVRGSKVHFMLGIHGTETGRFSCTNDHLGMGFNAQTIPTYAKAMLAFPPESDRVFLQCDLRQAESRFVAYDSMDGLLIEMLEDPTKDIHSHVAHEIIRTLNIDISGVSPEEFKKKWRQLGKKSGHGANYAMAEFTFMESCLKEMDLVLTRTEARGILEAYHRLFPGIRRWHQNIRETLRRERRLTNPLGRERYFYGRMDDATHREAYAYRPQSTVPDIVNALMLGMQNRRSNGDFDFWFHNQVHDSLVVSTTPTQVRAIAEYMLDTSLWHPEIKLPAGRLVIPTSVEVGRSLGKMEEYVPQ